MIRPSSAWARIQELESRGTAPVGTIGEGQPDRPQLDFGADPEAVAAVAEAVRLSSGHLASPTFATEISLIDPLPHQRVGGLRPNHKVLAYQILAG